MMLHQDIMLYQRSYIKTSTFSTRLSTAINFMISVESYYFIRIKHAIICVKGITHGES